MSSVMTEVISFVEASALSPEASPFSPVVVPVEASVEVPLAKVSVAPFMAPAVSFVVPVMVLFVIPTVPFVAPLMVPAAPCDSAPEASVEVLPAEAFVFSPEEPSVPFSPFESEDSEGPAASCESCEPSELTAIGSASAKGAPFVSSEDCATGSSCPPCSCESFCCPSSSCALSALMTAGDIAFVAVDTTIAATPIEATNFRNARFFIISPYVFHTDLCDVLLIWFASDNFPIIGRSAYYD
ncbi:unknown [Firmicutes bacterium CAG:791]|nr:unknown [Firmicutes bacterium CAG:791]